MWFAVGGRTDTQKPCVHKKIGLHAQNMVTVLGSIVSIIGGAYVIINEHESHNFETEVENIYMKSENYEEWGYSLESDLLTILY